MTEQNGPDHAGEHLGEHTGQHLSEPLDEHAGVEGGGLPFKLWDHIGVLSGVVFGLVGVGFLVVLAAAGDGGALAILCVIVAGIALIYAGGQFHGPRAGR
jgi:hypothetical protein